MKEKTTVIRYSQTPTHALYLPRLRQHCLLWAFSHTMPASPQKCVVVLSDPSHAPVGAFGLFQLPQAIHGLVRDFQTATQAKI